MCLCRLLVLTEYGDALALVDKMRLFMSYLATYPEKLDPVKKQQWAISLANDRLCFLLIYPPLVIAPCRAVCPAAAAAAAACPQSMVTRWLLWTRCGCSCRT
jgi:hypothetical protein